MRASLPEPPSRATPQSFRHPTEQRCHPSGGDGGRGTPGRIPSQCAMALVARWLGLGLGLGLLAGATAGSRYLVPDRLAASLGEQPPWTQAEMLEAAVGGRGR